MITMSWGYDTFTCPDGAMSLEFSTKICITRTQMRLVTRAHQQILECDDKKEVKAIFVIAVGWL